jgi:NAD(P)H-hydrate epimerase
MPWNPLAGEDNVISPHSKGSWLNQPELTNGNATLRQMRHSDSHHYEPSGHSDDCDRFGNAPMAFNREAVWEIDRLAIEEYGMPGIMLMENAARGLLASALHLLRDNSPNSALDHQNRFAVAVCGSGNNGGDGYALARHLHNRGVNVIVARIGEPLPNSDAGINREICRRIGIREFAIERAMDELMPDQISLIVDALFGTGLDRPVRGLAADAIAWMNAAHRPILAADVPSGMDCDTGDVLGCAVQATRTVTFVGLKTGFLGLDAQKLLGDVVVADIGVPRALIERFGERVDLPHREPPEHAEPYLQPVHASND